jgi:predicted ester cyclase
MPEMENIETVKQAIARFNAKDLEGYLAMYERSVVFHGLSRHLKPGVGGLRDYYTKLRGGFPDMRLTSEDLIADGEKTAHRYTFYGTHRGQYGDTPPTGKFVVSPGMVMHLFSGGKCVEIWQATDTLSFLLQIGAVPSLSGARR